MPLPDTVCSIVVVWFDASPSYMIVVEVGFHLISKQMDSVLGFLARLRISAPTLETLSHNIQLQHAIAIRAVIATYFKIGYHIESLWLSQCCIG